MTLTGIKNKFITQQICLPLVYLTAFAWFAWLSKNRLIARDEGFYLYATKLVTEGKSLYLDFFYPQGPVFPFIYTLPFQLFGASWDTARLTAACIATLITLLTFKLARRFANFASCTLAISFMLTCNIYWAWQATAQSYGPTLLLALLAFFFLPVQNSNSSKIRIFFCGACLSLAGLTRLYFFALLPLFLVYLIYSSTKKNNNIIFLFLLGSILPVTLFFVSNINNLELLYFNLVDYHLARADGGTIGSLTKKFDLLLSLIGLRPTQAFAGIQYAWLIVMALLGVIFTKQTQNQFKLIAASTFVIFIISLIPNPSYLQYFGLTVPFLTVLTAAYMQHMSECIKSVSLLAFIVLFAVIFYNLKLPEDLIRYTKTGQGVIGINNSFGAKIWNIQSVRTVAQALDQHTSKGDVVLSFWPGYLLESDTDSFSGFENHFATRAARSVKHENRAKYKVYRWDQVMEKMLVEPPKAIITKRDYFPPVFRNFLAEQSYRTIWEANSIIILVK